MSRCYCKYYAFCLYSLILFSSANSVALPNKVQEYEENQDYTIVTLDSTTEPAVSVTSGNVEIKFTTSEPGSLVLESESSTSVEMEIETTMGVPLQSSDIDKDFMEDAVKGSNMTVIIVGLLFAMTMIVKGVPVIVAYAIPYFTNNPITGPGDYPPKNGTSKEKDVESGIESEEKEKENENELHEIEKAMDDDDLKEIKIITDAEIDILNNIQEHKIMQEIHSNLKNDEKII